jgi:predicted nucleic acid-binding protein
LNDSAAVWKEAEDGDTIIYTSFFTFAEVFKAKCEGEAKPLSVENDVKIEQFLRQKWVRPAVVDERIGIAARRLMRHHPQCKKPSDGIHLATALALNVDEMHTYDNSDLLGLTGKIMKPNGSPLTICPPKPVPKPPAPPPPQDELFPPGS